MKKLLVLALSYGAFKTWTNSRTTKTFNDFVRENNLQTTYNNWYSGYQERKINEWDIRTRRW